MIDRKALWTLKPWDLLDNPSLGVELAQAASDALDMAYKLCEQLGEDAFVEESYREQARAFLKEVT